MLPRPGNTAASRDGAVEADGADQPDAHPYAGSAGAVKDLAGGHVSAMFLPIHTALPLAETGQIRILAVGSQARAQQAAQVPTLAELGVTGFDVDLWYAVLAPAGTPKDDRRALQCGVQRDPGAAERSGRS